MTINVNVRMNEKTADMELQTGRFGTVSISGRKQDKENAKAGSLMLNGQFDPIEQKKAFAKKQAYKIVKDALAKELKKDADVQAYKDHAVGLQTDMDQAQEEIRKIDDRKEALRTDSGVEADSEEQRDLELLEKRAAYERGDFSKVLTKEEIERVQTLDERGYTEYQKQALEMEKHKAPYEDAVSRAQNGIISDNAVIRGTRLERLKKHYIRKAQNEKDDMLAAAGKEIIGMLVDEAKDHMDEKREEMETLADAGNDSEESTPGTQPVSVEKAPMTEVMVQLDTQRDDYQREIEEMMRKMNLMAEDIKGIRVDETF